VAGLAGPSAQDALVVPPLVLLLVLITITSACLTFIAQCESDNYTL
jgi:hypothetical protein